MKMNMIYRKQYKKNLIIIKKIIKIKLKLFNYSRYNKNIIMLNMVYFL